MNKWSFLFAESTKLISPYLPAEDLPNFSHISQQTNDNQPDQVVERVKWVNCLNTIFIFIVFTF